MDKDLLAEMEGILNPKVEAKVATFPQDKIPVWMKGKVSKKNPNATHCWVISNDNKLYKEARVNLNGIDAGDFTWGYYGTDIPVLIEDGEGKLNPFYLPDAVGESPILLFLANFPENYKALYKRENTFLKKLAIWLMVALVGVLLLFMVIFIGSKK